MGRAIQYIFLILSVGFIAYTQALETVPNEYILKLKPNSKEKFFTSDKSNSDITVIKRMAGMMHVSLSKNAYQTLKSEVEFIEPNYIYKIPDLIAHDDIDMYDIPSKQWGLKAGPGVNAKKAWEITKGKSNIVVAVIDTGVDYNHRALANNMWVNTKEKLDGTDTDGNGYVDDIYGYDFANDNGDPLDDHNHGTHCAGIIAANATYAKGIAPKVSIMALKFLTKSGKGSLAGAVASIEYAVDNGADILSNSWGATVSSDSLKEAIKYAERKGVLFVAAAGNDGRNNDSRPIYPASYTSENIISVAAHNSWGRRAYFSNYGKRSVDIFAPGDKILSTVRNNKLKTYSGTSMATPFVAGAAALYLSEYGHVHYSTLKSAILNSAHYSSSLNSYVNSEGYLDAYEMLKF